MAKFCQLLLLCCVVRICKTITAKPLKTAKPITTDKPFTTATPLGNDRNFTCSESKLRVLFAGYTWTIHTGAEKIPRDMVHDEYFVGIMEIIVDVATEGGINCEFDKLTYLLVCCDTGDMTKLHQLLKYRKEFTGYGADLSQLNIAFLVINFMLFVLILSLELALWIKYPDTRRIEVIT